MSTDTLATIKQQIASNPLTLRHAFEELSLGAPNQIAKSGEVDEPKSKESDNTKEHLKPGCLVEVRQETKICR